MVSDDSSLQGGSERAGVDLYFLSSSSAHHNNDPPHQPSLTFKSTVLYRPYFYVVPTFSPAGPATTEDATQLSIVFELIISQLHRLYNNSNSQNHSGTAIHSIEIVYKQDLDELNHLSPTSSQCCN
jgi:hypothetical protein